MSCIITPVHTISLRDGALLVEHIGFPEQGSKPHKALDICDQYKKKRVMTGRDNSANSAQFGEYLIRIVEAAGVESRWEEYVEAA